MSKAFTRESDEDEDGPARPLGAELPPGVKNYLTPEGAARLRAEVARLADVERPAAAARGDAPALRELDRRLAFLGRRMEALEVIDPAGPPGNRRGGGLGVSPIVDRVLFGASVLVRDEDGAERRYRLVGIDEADPSRGEVSWRSPVATALLGARVGNVVTLRSPRGDEELEVVEVSYGGP